MSKPRKPLERALAPRRPLVNDAKPPKAPRPNAGLDGLQNVIAGLGSSRDKRAYSQYIVPGVIDRVTLESMYTGSWLPARIVDAVADDMTREWLKLNWDGYDNDTSSIQAVEVEEARLGVRQKFNEALKWARLYGGGVIIMDIAGDTDWSIPLRPETVKKGGLQALHVYDRWWCSATGQLDYNRGSQNFGLPEFYMIGAPGETSARVHWSRVIRFDGRHVPKNVWLQRGFWHDSVLQHIIDTIQDFDATKGGIASMVWEANVDILLIEELAEMLGTAGGEQKIQKLMQLAMTSKSFNRVLMLDKNQHDYKQKTTQFSGVVDVFREFISEICGAAEIPPLRLFGTAPKGLAASGDNEMRSYYDTVKAKQTTDIRPGAERFYQVFMRSAVGAVPRNFRINFNPLWQLSDLDRSTMNKTQAETDQIYWNMGVLNEGSIARELKDRDTYRTMESADVQLAEELAKEPDPVPTAPVVPPKAPAPGAQPVPGAKQGAA